MRRPVRFPFAFVTSALLLACGSGDDGSSSPSDSGAPDEDATTANDATTSGDGAAPEGAAGDDATTSGDDSALGQDAGTDANGDANDAGDASDAAHATDANDAALSDADAGDASSDAGAIDFVPGVQVATLAGSDVSGSQDGTGAAAEFDNPTGIAIDANGNLLVTDYDGARVRLVTSLGAVTTIASATGFAGPFAAAVATDGAYYISTDFNSAGTKNTTSGTIWRVVPIDGGIATPTVVAAGFGRPRGIAAIAGGNLFLADRLHDTVADLNVTIGDASFLAGQVDDAGFHDGTGAAAKFDSPIGAAALSDGSVLVADANNNRIRQISSTGDVTTFAGDGTAAIKDGPRLTAQLSAPRDVATDAAGNVYVSDTGNHCIRRIRTDGTVDTLAGNGTQGFANGAGDQAEFYGQEGIDVSPDGKTVWVADGNGGDGSAFHRIRVITIP